MIRHILQQRAGRPAAVIILAAALVLIAGCAKDLYFDDPAPELVVENIRREPKGGGTFYWGDVRNAGSLAAEDILIHITPRGAGGASLGTYTTTVGIGFDEAEETVVNILEPEETGAFKLNVPVPYGAIVSDTWTFTYTTPLEEESE
jgi:hypothetical protein